MAISASALTVGVDSSSAASSYSYTASSLPAGAKILLVFVWGKVGTNQFISSVTAAGGQMIKLVGVTDSVGAEGLPMAVFYTDQITGTSAAIQANFSASMTGAVVGHVVVTGTTALSAYCRTAKATITGASITSDAFPAQASSDSLSFCIYNNNRNGAGTFTPTFSADAGSPTTLVGALAAVSGLAYGAGVNTDSTATTFTSAGIGSSATQVFFTFQFDAAASIPTTDGLATGTFSGSSSGTATLTTGGASDAIVVIVGYEGGSGGTLPRTVSSVTATGLTFTKRGGTTAQESGRPNDGMEIWSAPASAALASKVITVTMSAAIDDASIIAFGVTGLFDTSNPFDANGALPAFTTSNASATPAAVPTITTTTASDLLLAASLVVDGHNDTASATWDSIANANNGGGSLWSFLSAWKKPVAAVQAASNAGQNSAATWIAIRYADAFKGIAASVTPPSTWVPKIIGPY